MSIAERALTGSLVGIVSFGVNLGLAIVHVPMLLGAWGNAKYGLWLGIYAFAGMITAFDAGFQNFVGNRILSQYNTDISKLEHLIGSALRAAVFVGCCEFAGAVALIVFGLQNGGGEILGMQITNDTLGAILVYLSGWIVLGIIPGIVLRVFIPRGEYVRTTLWDIGIKLGQFGGLCIAVVAGAPLVMTMAAMCLAGMPFVIGMTLDARRRMPEVKSWWKAGELQVGLGMFARSIALTATSFLEQFGNNGLVLAIGRSLGVARVPDFTTVRTVTNTAMASSNIFTAPLRADIVRFYVSRDSMKLNELFAGIWLVTSVLLEGGFLLSPFVIEPMYAAWTRGRLAFDPVLFDLLAVAVCLRSLAAPLLGFLFSVNALREQLIITIVRAASLLGAAVILLPTLGLLAAAIAMVFAEAVASICCGAYFAHRILRNQGGVLRFDYLLAPFTGAVLVGAALLAATRFPSWKETIVMAALVLVVMQAIYQFSCISTAARERIAGAVRLIYHGVWRGLSGRVQR